MITNEQILEEISKYSPNSERLTLSTLMAINQKIHILNVGREGIGKTRNTEELLNLLKIPHSLIAGHYSPKAVYEILEKDGIVVIDEGADLLSDKTTLNLLLNALWNGECEWVNNRESHKHHFTGILIFSTNKVENTPLMNALKDRVFTNYVELTSEQIKEKILSGRTYKPDMKIWAEIKERIIQNKKDISDIPAGENEKIYHLIETSGELKSVREIWKLKKIASFSYSLIGDLGLIDFFKQTDDIWKVINSKIKRSEKVKKIAELKCISERQARRIVEKYDERRLK